MYQGDTVLQGYCSKKEQSYCSLHSSVGSQTINKKPDENVISQKVISEMKGEKMPGKGITRPEREMGEVVILYI